MPPRDKDDPIRLGFPGLRDVDMDGIQRSLGRIEGKLESIEESNRKQVVDLDEHKAESREGRSKIYAKVEATNQAITEIRHDLADVRSTVETMNTTIEKHEKGFKRFNDFEQRLLGVAWFISAVSAAIGVTIAVAWKWIIAKFGLV